MIKGILFDKDGTLLEFSGTMHHIYTDVMACLQDRYQVPEPLLQAVKQTLGYQPDRLHSDSLLQFSTNPQIVDAIMIVSRQYAARHDWPLPYTDIHLLELIEQRSLAPGVPYTALPGVPETLATLKDKHYPMGIATADTRAATELGLKNTGLLSYFNFLGTSDMGAPKPDPFLALTFCRHCGIGCHELLIVGDSANDMRFARNTGARFLGIVSASQPGFPPTDFAHNTTVNINRMIDIFNL